MKLGRNDNRLGLTETQTSVEGRDGVQALRFDNEKKRPVQVLVEVSCRFELSLNRRRFAERSQPAERFERRDVMLQVFDRVQTDVAPCELRLELESIEAREPESLRKRQTAIRVEMNCQFDETLLLCQASRLENVLWNLQFNAHVAPLLLHSTSTKSTCRSQHRVGPRILLLAALRVRLVLCRVERVRPDSEDEPSRQLTDSFVGVCRNGWRSDQNHTDLIARSMLPARCPIQ